MKKFYIFAVCFTMILAGSRGLLSADRLADSIVSITVTSQAYDFNEPWQKLSVRKDIISGIVLKDKKILTSAYGLADHVLLEVSKFGAYRKYPAEVILKDYQCGLALITVPDTGFFNDLKPVQFNLEGSIKSKSGIVARWEKNGIFKEYAVDYLKSAIEFFESSGAVLIHEMISEIESGGKSEPVFIDGRLAGITSWHYPKTKTIKVIDLEVIERMLKDGDSNYRGMPFFYIKDTALENDENLRSYLGLADEDTGIFVSSVPSTTSGSDALKKGDVILSINGTDVDDNGYYMSPKYGKLNYSGLIYLDHFPGDIIKMKIIRDKKKMDISFRLKPFSNDCFLIPAVSFDTPPKYYIAGGLVFQELTREYLMTWGKEWSSTADKRLMYYYDNYSRYPDKDRKRIVILSTVLPASVNVGYHRQKNLILDKVNGKRVSDINHVKNIVDKLSGKYIVFSFVGENSIIVNRRDAADSINDIMKKYNIHVPFYLGK